MKTDEPAVIVSNDTHVGPRLVKDLRPYCPSGHLEEFDRFAASTAAELEDARIMLDGSGYLDHPNFRTLGHYNSAARLADYDHDGIAAGVIFHGSTNMEPIPFVSTPLGKPNQDPGPELLGVGQMIYNLWLADFGAQAPDRHIGLAYLPLWDLEQAITVLRWAREMGLRGVNFPAMRDGDLPEYNRRLWEPFWSECEELGMPLVTHVGSGTNARYSGLEAIALMQLESSDLSRRALPWMIFGGVFERHPALKLVITETPGNWVSSHVLRTRRHSCLLQIQGRSATQPSTVASGPGNVPVSTWPPTSFSGPALRHLSKSSKRLRTASRGSCCGVPTTPTSKARSSTAKQLTFPPSLASHSATASATHHKQIPRAWSATTPLRSTALTELPSELSQARFTHLLSKRLRRRSTRSPLRQA
jgi:Amidohydrolase